MNLPIVIIGLTITAIGMFTGKKASDESGNTHDDHGGNVDLGNVPTDPGTEDQKTAGETFKPVSEGENLL